MKPSRRVAASVRLRLSPASSLSSRLHPIAQIALTNDAEQLVCTFVLKSCLKSTSLKSMWTGCTHVK